MRDLKQQISPNAHSTPSHGTVKAPLELDDELDADDELDDPDDDDDDELDDALEVGPAPPAPKPPCPLLLLVLLVDASAPPSPPFPFGVGAWSSKHPLLTIIAPMIGKQIANKVREAMRTPPAVDFESERWRCE
jgi:hypothetical protein